jgi:hypothetical protein
LFLFSLSFFSRHQVLGGALEKLHKYGGSLVSGVSGGWQSGGSRQQAAGWCG